MCRKRKRGRHLAAEARTPLGGTDISEGHPKETHFQGRLRTCVLSPASEVALFESTDILLS